MVTGVELQGEVRHSRRSQQRRRDLSDIMWELGWWECSRVWSMATWGITCWRFWIEGRRYLSEAHGLILRVVGSLGMLDLTWTTCGSSGVDGSSSVYLVDVKPGSGVYWGPVYSGIYANKARCEWLSSEKRLAWYGWGTWIVVHRWKSLVAGWAWLFDDQDCTCGWKNGFSVKVSFL